LNFSVKEFVETGLFFGKLQHILQFSGFCGTARKINQSICQISTYWQFSKENDILQVCRRLFAKIWKLCT
jgi:hypothetical protein